jgi:hypothetical protein
MAMLNKTKLGALVLLALGGCASTGLGDGPRKDVTARMATIQQPVQGCYEAALKRNRKLKGLMTLSFDTAPDTGKFTNIKVVRNDLPDPELEACVKEQVGGLALAAPTKTKIGVEYPLSFNAVD